MAQIKINFSGVKAANTSLQKTLQRMGQIEDALCSLQGNVDSDVQSRYQIRSQLKNCRSEAAALYSKTKKLRVVVADSVIAYQNTESRLLRNTPDRI